MSQLNQSSENELFNSLINTITAQARLIAEISEKISKIESIGGGDGGSASIKDYESEKAYKRNVLLVDPSTETMYRVLQDYVSDTVENDCHAGKLKLVGFESQIISMSHKPTQAEIDAMPDDAWVAIYSASDAPYLPDEQE